MDWCNFNNFQHLQSWAGFRALFTNAWQMSPRVQFLSWMLQAVTLKFFGYRAAPHFVVSLGAHVVSSVLVGRMTRKATGSPDAGRAAAVLCLVFPTSAGALFIINNAFFVLSFFSAVLTAYLLMFPLRRIWTDVAAVTCAALFSQFLGEQTIPLLYLILAGFGIREARTNGWRRSLLRAGIPFAACAAALLVYYFIGVKPYTNNYPLHWSSGIAIAFTKKFILSHVEALNFTSWMYGGLSLPPSADTVFIALPLIVVLWLLLVKTETAPNAAPAENVLVANLFLAAGLAATAIPVVYSALTGYRTAVETRYLYCSGLVTAAMIPFLVELATRRLSEKIRSQAGRWLFVALASYLGVLMVYDLRDVWGGQKLLDERIWAQVDANFNPQVKFVATDGMQYATLLPVTRSNAVSDFHEDFGVRCRIKAVHHADITPLRRPIADSGDFAMAAPYRGNPQPVRKSELLSILFRYEKRYSDVLGGKLIVFSKFDDYAKYRKDEPFFFKD